MNYCDHNANKIRNNSIKWSITRRADNRIAPVTVTEPGYG